MTGAADRVAWRDARRAPVVVGALALWLLCACTAPSSAEPSLAASPEPSSTSVPIDCGSIDLRTPQGQRLDLTGRWVGGSIVHDIRQLGSCVWWVARPPDPDDDSFLLVFIGLVQPDFSLTGEWADIYTTAEIGHRQARATFRIEFSEEAGQEVITLRYVTLPLSLAQCCSYYTNDLTRVADESP